MVIISITDAFHYFWIFTCLLGIWTHVLMLTQQAWWSYFSSTNDLLALQMYIWERDRVRCMYACVWYACMFFSLSLSTCPCGCMYAMTHYRCHRKVLHICFTLYLVWDRVSNLLLFSTVFSRLLELWASGRSVSIFHLVIEVLGLHMLPYLDLNMF